MALIEGVRRERYHIVVYLVAHAFGHAVFDATGYNRAVVHSAVEEHLAFLFHGVHFLLAHHSAHVVRPAERVAAERLHHLHNLLLIHHYAVAYLEYGLGERVVVLYLIGIFLVEYVFAYLVHRTGAVKRNARYYIFERGRL